MRPTLSSVGLSVRRDPPLHHTQAPSPVRLSLHAVTLCVALLGAVGGILVAMVIKYADGLAKNLATASSIVVTTALR